MMRDSVGFALPSEIRRQRTMTGESCSCSSIGSGSFATYMSTSLHNRDDTQYPKGTDEQQFIPSTSNLSDIEQEGDAIEARLLQEGTTNAVQSLNQISEGIRIVTRRLKQAHETFENEVKTLENDEDCTETQRERSWSDSVYTCRSFASSIDDDRRLSDLSQQLEGTLGADLLALAHAAHMAGENSRMVAQEATQSVSDVHVAQQSIMAANKRADRAENAVRMMYKKQKELIGQLEQTKRERNVLKRQVKALLQEKSISQEQENVVRVLELHVAKALQDHERHLAVQHSKSEEEQESGNVATVRLECLGQDEGVMRKKEANADDEHVSQVQESPDPSPTNVVSDEKLEDATVDSSAKESLSEELTQKASSDTVRGSAKFGSAFGGYNPFGRRSSSHGKHKSESKLTTENENFASNNKELQEPALISPTNSIGEQRTALSTETTQLYITEKDDSVRNETVTPTNESVSSRTNPRPISPSPTDQATHRKGFFRRSNRAKSRATKTIPNANTRKPLLRLDDESGDAREGSHDYTTDYDTVPEITPGSESVSSTSALSCDTTTGHISPMFATGPSMNSLDDKAFRSLALPSFVEPSPREEEPSEIASALSPTCPPELAEIAAIYAEIGQLHEC